MIRRMFILFMLLVLAIPASAQEGKKFTAPRLMPGGGVADSEGKLGFYPNTTGGIDALDLATGKLLWSTKEATQPLLATENRLYAQAPIKGKGSQVRVLVFDTTQQGKRVLESMPIAFPDWVTTGTTYGRSFRSGARLDIQGLWLAWEARAWYAGGARPTPEIEKAARKEASGVSRIDLDTGKTEPADAAKIAEVKFFPLPSLGASVKIGDVTYAIKDMPAKKPGNPFQQRRVLQATGTTGMLWQHELAAPVFLPPPP